MCKAAISERVSISKNLSRLKQQSIISFSLSWDWMLNILSKDNEDEEEPTAHDAEPLVSEDDVDALNQGVENLPHARVLAVFTFVTQGFTLQALVFCLHYLHS